MQIQECDAILAGFEGVLGRFQGDLGNISSEIRALQEQSNGMGARLRGRRAVQARLAGFIAQLALPPALIPGMMAVRGVGGGRSGGAARLQAAESATGAALPAASLGRVFRRRPEALPAAGGQSLTLQRRSSSSSSSPAAV